MSTHILMSVLEMENWINLLHNNFKHNRTEENILNESY